MQTAVLADGGFGHARVRRADEQEEMAQMQPTSMAMAVPVAVAAPTAGRSQEEMVSLFGGLDGIEVAVRSDQHDSEGTYQFLSQVFQQQSTLMNPFGIATATRGSFSIKSTAEGNPEIATLCVATGDRFRGDMAAAIVLPDNTVLAQWSRSSRPTMISSGETDLPVSVFGAPYGKMQTSKWGMGHSYVDASGKGVRPRSHGCFQCKTYWCIASFCLFFPTCSIASIAIICCVMPGVPGLYDLKTTPDGPSVGLLKLWQQGGDISESSKIKLEITPGTDAQTRTAAALAALFMIADIFIDPPKGGNHGGGGAPHAAEMDR
mmetsp:Transcript_18490/g.54457  ORF Transcript_18490/g.54457 Transcript_18490/m.54457 type:complete len:319 (-) Transcript_18490:2098-3054(-)